jgi:ABC-type transport system substrate-binding protein
MDQWIYPWWHTDGGLNYNNVNDTDLDALLVAQRAEVDPEAKKQIWQQVWDRIHDQVYDFWWPEADGRRGWHNYMLNYRGHGLMGTYVCYVSGQARAIWLDEGTPNQ